MSRYVIRKMRLAHCKRGPSLCEKCREMDVEKLCLLDICPPNMGMMQRRVIEVEYEGEMTWREFDIVKTFETEQQAREYAEQNGIEDVEI